MNKIFLALMASLLMACSQFEPFEDMRREAGQIPTIGRSSNDRPVICYNPLWHNEETLNALADSACARTNRKAIRQETDTFSCCFVNPSAAVYLCK